MRRVINGKVVFAILFGVYFVLAGLTMPAASAAGTDSLSGIRTAKAVFDFRIGTGTAVAHLNLIHNTFKELKEAGKSPDAVVVFIGPSVNLISSSRKGLTDDERRVLDDVARKVTEMSKDGIRFEICMVAAKVFKVDPTTILPEISQVPNGWVSLIGFQNQGYALVPAY